MARIKAIQFLIKVRQKYCLHQMYYTKKTNSNSEMRFLNLRIFYMFFHKMTRILWEINNSTPSQRAEIFMIM